MTFSPWLPVFILTCNICYLKKCLQYFLLFHSMQRRRGSCTIMKFQDSLPMTSSDLLERREGHLTGMQKHNTFLGFCCCPLFSFLPFPMTQYQFRWFNPVRPFSMKFTTIVSKRCVCLLIWLCLRGVRSPQVTYFHLWQTRRYWFLHQSYMLGILDFKVYSFWTSNYFELSFEVW